MEQNSYGDFSNYCNQGGTFIVAIPSEEGGDTAKNVIGLELTGYKDSSGKSVTPGININLGDG